MSDRYQVERMGRDVSGVYDVHLRVYARVLRNSRDANTDALALADVMERTAATLSYPRTEAMPGAYYDAYCAAAVELSGRPVAQEWWSLGISAEQAAHWARFHFTPVEAWPWMEIGVPPDEADHAAEYRMTAETYRPWR